MLVQVCLELNNDNIDRELDGLLEAMESLNTKEATIVTLNQKDSVSKKGTDIQVLPFFEFVENFKP
jgi:hypothetical protein